MALLELNNIVLSNGIAEVKQYRLFNGIAKIN